MCEKPSLYMRVCMCVYETEYVCTRVYVFGLISLFNGISTLFGGARGVVVIVVGNGHGDTSSNPGRDWLHFT